MYHVWRRAAGWVTLALAVPVFAAAQDAATITGTVVGEAGEPLVGAFIRITTLDLATVTNNEGQYTLTVPASRAQGQEEELTVSFIGYATETAAVTLQAGAAITQDFTLGYDPLKLDEIVVTGSGTEREREKLAVTVNSVSAEEIIRSNEANLVSALSGKAPNVNVTTSSGEPGAGAYIRIRSASSIVGGTQPLFVVDGTPIDNSSHNIESTLAGTVVQNRVIDINPSDIQSVEILKGAAATAIYGSRGANGVVLITTKSGAPGSTRVTYSTSISVDEMNATVPLQTAFGRGFDGAPEGSPGVNTNPEATVSWGPLLPEGTPTFDHASEVFDTGLAWQNDLTLSGGSDRTTYYLSLSRLDHDGFIVGNSAYDRNTVRLKGTHFFFDNLRIGGNFAYTQSDGNYIQQGSNISGLLLASLRTPPEFNNLPYLDPETGLHRSYRNQNPTSLEEGRGYDNPFWIANEISNESEVGRAFGNINLNYRPLSWLTLDYTLGLDYANDERLTLFPKSSSSLPTGQVIRASLVDKQVDHLLLVTATRSFSDAIGGSLTLGQNLNQREYEQYLVTGTDVIFGTEELDFAIDKVPDEYKERIRTDGYFAEANVDLWSQLYLTGRIRADASSTFGSDDNRFWYPSFGAAWEFTQLPTFQTGGFLSYGKLRGNWGVVGRQPPVFSNITAYETETFGDGWLNTGLESIYNGQDGVTPDETLGNPEIDPERKTGWEVGTDLGFLDQRVNLALTYYKNVTEDAILAVDVSPSTGFTSQWKNGAEFEAEGFEATLDVVALRTDNVEWTVGAQYAQSETCVTSLSGTETFGLGGFAGSSVQVVAPDPITGECHPFGVIFGQDFVRFGRDLQVDGVEIDQAFPEAPAGALYIAEDGFPIMEDRERVIGNPYPDWTGSIRSTVTLFDNLQISGLLDVSQGNEMWNGTKGALFSFGTHAGTLPWHGAGKDTVFPGFGPGAGQQARLDWQSWGYLGLGNGFTGPASQFIEDASFVKLRDITVAYTLRPEWLERLGGFQTARLTVSGRNLKTWTDYTGIDPESNLTGQTAARGLDYFNNPRTRSWVFKLTLNR